MNTHNRKEFRFLLLLAGFFAIIFIFVIPSSDTELSDTECKELHWLWEEKYRKDFNFGGSWGFENFQCNSPESAIINALYFLDITTIILPADEQAFDFYDWAKNQNALLRKKSGLTFAGVANFEEGRIDLSTIELEKGDPVLTANTLIHELRHLEEGYNSHVPCAKQPKLTCDARLEENLFEGGAYNYNVAYLHRLIAYGSISRQRKYSATTLLTRILDNKINAVSQKSRAKYE